jgi:hypothetical protein
VAISVISAIVLIPVSFWFLPWPWALLLIAVVTWGLYEARKRGFDIWEWWPWWLWWWW